MLTIYNLASNWKQWKKVWQRYEIATGIYKQEDLVRVSTLLSVIGEEAVKAFDTFAWAEGQNENKITDVLAKFDQYCEPRIQVIYERYRFNNRKQEPGESISAYVTELRVIAKNCAHNEITPDEILRDRLVLGVRDEKLRERLLRVNDLTLTKAVDICKASEQTSQQLKLITNGAEESVQLKPSHLRTHGGLVIRPSSGQNADFVDISMEIASAQPEGKRVTSVD